MLWVAGLVRASEQGRAPKPLLLLAMLLWANLHGGFTLGLMLCGFFALEAVVTAANAAQRRFLFVEWLKFGVAAVLVACITPYGPESMLVTLRIFGLGEALSLIKEWQSPDFQNLPMQELMLLAAIFGALACGLKLPVLRLLLVLGFLHLFLKHARNIELLAVLTPLVVAPILARQWPSLRPDRGAFSRRASRMVEHYACAFVRRPVCSVHDQARQHPAADRHDAGRCARVRPARELQGPVFNDYDFGGFLIHAGSRPSSTGAASCSAATSSSAMPMPSSCAATIRSGSCSIVTASNGRSCTTTSRPTSCSSCCRAGTAPTATRRRPSSCGQRQIKSAGANALRSTVQPLARFRRVAEDRQRAPGIDLAERFGHLLLELGSDDDGDRPDRSRLGKLEDLL